MMPEPYLKMPFKSPNEFVGKHQGQKLLIIGTGHSTKNLVNYAHYIDDVFDVVIGLNFSTRNFEEFLDYHMILEKNPINSYKDMIENPHNYRNELPRILNWKSIVKFPQHLNIYKATRTNFDLDIDLLKYRNNGYEGFLIGPQDPQGLSAGSVMLNAMHFGCMIGATEIYLSGADLMFKDEFDHYYPDSLYRKSQTKKKNRSPIIDVMHNGKSHKTTQFFKYSAKYIDEMIVKMNQIGIKVFDFSDGLITNAINIDMDQFFGDR